jgi:divalent metal cation (Fe/Co/Zn/Cd) transporter
VRATDIGVLGAVMLQLAGVALNVLVGWWWADPVAALAMTPLIVREGLEGVRGRSSCRVCCS